MSERREATDLRLVPAALGAWAAALGVTAVHDSRATLLVALVCVGLLLVVVVVRRRLARAAGGLLLGLVAVLVVLGSGAAHGVAENRGGLLALIDERAVVNVTGVLRSDAVPAPTPWDPTSERTRFVVAVTELQARGRSSAAGARLLVTVSGPASGLVRGTEVRISGRLTANALPGSGTVGGLAAREVVIRRAAHGVDAGVARLRAGLLAVTDGLDPRARGLVPGMTLGDTSRLPPDTAAAMRTVGLTHLTAVSGTHVAVVALVIGSLAVRLRAPRGVRAAVAAVAIGGFVLLVHPEPSVLRAALMGAVGIGGLLLGRSSVAVPALAATVIVLLATEPGLARSVGFTLSVVATAAIVLLAVPAAALLPRLPRPLVHAVAVPLAAQSACGPILVLLDPHLSLWAVPANLAAAPAVLPATVLGLLATLVEPWSVTVAAALAHGAGWATGWIAEVAEIGAGLPGARLGWQQGAPGAVALAALTALAWMVLARAVRSWPDRAAGPHASAPGVGAPRSLLARGRLVPCPPPRVDRSHPP